MRIRVRIRYLQQKKNPRLRIRLGFTRKNKSAIDQWAGWTGTLWMAITMLFSTIKLKHADLWPWRWHTSHFLYIFNYKIAQFNQLQYTTIWSDNCFQCFSFLIWWTGKKKHSSTACDCPVSAAVLLDCLANLRQPVVSPSECAASLRTPDSPRQRLLASPAFALSSVEPKKGLSHRWSQRFIGSDTHPLP